MVLPVWYKSYILANGWKDLETNDPIHISSMDDRPFEFVYNVLKLRPHLMNIFNDKILLCMTDPSLIFRKIYDIIGDMLKRFKQMNINDDPDHKAVAVRNLAYGISAGNNDLQNYEKWTVVNDRALENKKRVKNSIENIFTKEMVKLS